LGYTLVELVMVMVMIGILAAIAVPRLSDGSVTRRLDAAERRVLGDTEYASELARARSSPVVISFDVLGSGYTIAGTSNPITREASNYIVRLKDAPYRVRVGTVNLGGDSAISFNGFGVRDSGGTVDLIAGDTTRTITIDAP